MDWINSTSLYQMTKIKAKSNLFINLFIYFILGNINLFNIGEMAERFKAHAWKAC